MNKTEVCAFRNTGPSDSHRWAPRGGDRVVMVCLVALLGACGGGSGDGRVADNPRHADARADARGPMPADRADPLPEVDAASRASVAGTSVPEAVSQAAARTAVYRFYNGQTGAHFYTVSASERDRVRNTMPVFQYEGAAFEVSAATASGLSPVYRFYNEQTGVHFYSISAEEKAYIETHLAQFKFEGIAYYASKVSGGNLLPLHRFYVQSKGFHFYSSDESEVARIRAALPDYRYEGISYYSLGSDWPANPLKLVHSGVQASHCYGAGSNELMACSSSSVATLNTSQDGHRAHLNPMSYATVPGFPVTSCVRDLVTGLVWEGKEASGARVGNRSFTHVGDGRAGDASQYVNEVNAMKLCGYSDWRVPDMHELMGLVDHSIPTPGPKVQVAWFPNTYANSPYWTTARLGAYPTRVEVVDFGIGRVHTVDAALGYRLRLVRGARAPVDRFRVTSVPYPGDFTGNAVFDRLSGLIWRRCFEGSTWTGSGCSGSLAYFTHEPALQHAQGKAGWRLPNIKELYSIVTAATEYPAYDKTAFPQALERWHEGRTWQSTPCMGCADGGAWFANLATGSFREEPRTRNGLIRLVAAAP